MKRWTFALIVRELFPAQHIQHRPVKLSDSNFASYLAPSTDTELSKDTDCQNGAFHHSGGVIKGRNCGAALESGV